MREIKFRVWGKDFKKYFYDIAIFSDGTLWIKFDEDGYDDVGLINELQSEFILEQYTGLKDKNGVEIYEGDIVKDKYIHGKIIYVDYMFMIYSYEDCSNQEYLMYVNGLEVIGNIHENEDLLSNE